MASSKVFQIVTIVCMCIFIYPLAITDIVLGVLHPGTCDNVDIMGLSVAQYLLALGIFSLVYGTGAIIMTALILAGIAIEMVSLLMVVLTIICSLFNFSWFIVGAIVLFRSNISCINDGSTTVIYALVLWCLTTFAMIHHCCHIHDHRNK